MVQLRVFTVGKWMGVVAGRFIFLWSESCLSVQQK